jgi:RNA polymerase sigma-70 factor (ECF subfamily)
MTQHQEACVVNEEVVQLGQRCLTGDRGALREFVQLYQQQVFSLCFRMLGHREDAEDIAQDSLMRAIRYLSSWDSAQPLTPWVMKIAANRCRTAMGKRAKLPKLAQIEHLQQNQPEKDTTLAEELQLAMEVLQEHQKTCFILFYQQEFSIAEISEIMETPSGTIKTWLHRSRKLLAQRLKERGIDPGPPTAET